MPLHLLSRRATSSLWTVESRPILAEASLNLYDCIVVIATTHQFREFLITEVLFQ